MFRGKGSRGTTRGIVSGFYAGFYAFYRGSKIFYAGVEFRSLRALKSMGLYRFEVY